LINRRPGCAAIPTHLAWKRSSGRRRSNQKGRVTERPAGNVVAAIAAAARSRTLRRWTRVV